MKAEWKLDDGFLDVKFWLNQKSLGEACWAQLRNLRRLPFAVQHLAVMPDAHVGYGMPIGVVLATQDAVVPNAVGVDIGCGMVAVRLSDLVVGNMRDAMENLRALIKQAVPVGRNWHKECCDDDEMPDMPRGSVTVNQYDRARKQLGTLGGGNHFIEVQTDQHGDIWVMIHSGSRNLGKQVADFYNNWAKVENKKNFSQVTPNSDLAFFHRDHEGYHAYIEEMNYCVAFAKQNRAEMMLNILGCFRALWPNTVISKYVDICHNHASMENHLGKNVLVHRKGAAGPYFGNTHGIIPGSMGTKSYIVTHTGEKMSFASTSHGAGRPMSRNDAKKTLDLEAQQAILDEIGVVHDLRSVKALDESPGAYRDIEEVMALQSDLCNIEYTLTPVLSIKG
jgi:tRNA-splicing ligase RtcB